MADLNIIFGSPCCGKTKYVQENKSDDDIVIDLDYLKYALTYKNIHSDVDDETINYLWDLRNNLLDNPIQNKNYWLITTVNDNKKYKQFDTVNTIYIEQTKENIYDFIENDGSREDKQFWKDLVDSWFEKNVEEKRCLSVQNIELRFIDFSVVETDSENLLVSGYVNEVGKYSHTLGKRKKFKERIMPGAFERALSNNSDIHFLAEHDSNKILASTRNESLQLKEDEKGLFMSAKICQTTYGKDYHTLIQSGILRSMSFGFNVLKDSWKKLNDGTFTRDIQDLMLYEVSVVTNPAYPQSTISARGLHLVEEVDIPNDITEERDMSNEVEEVVDEKKEVIDENKKTEEETQEVELKKDEVKEKTEERAYIGGIYDSHDIMNECLQISASCMTIAKYFSTKDVKPELVKAFKNFAKTCNDLMLNQVQVPEVVEGVAVNGSLRNEEVEIEKTEENQPTEQRKDINHLYDMLNNL